MATVRCTNCNKELNADEIGIFKRLVSRGATEYLCIPCLADYYKCGISIIYDRIAYYKEMGCTLFVSDNEG